MSFKSAKKFIDSFISENHRTMWWSQILLWTFCDDINLSTSTLCFVTINNQRSAWFTRSNYEFPWKWSMKSVCVDKYLFAFSKMLTYKPRGCNSLLMTVDILEQEKCLSVSCYWKLLLICFVDVVIASICILWSVSRDLGLIENFTKDKRKVMMHQVEIQELWIVSLSRFWVEICRYESGIKKRFVFV